MRLISLFVILLFSLPAHADVQLANYSTAVDAPVIQENTPVIITESPYSLAKTISNLKKAIDGKNFRLIRVQKVDQGYTNINNESSDLIVYFCNFNLVNKAVKMDNRIGQFLPFRVTAVQRAGKVYLMAANPKALSYFLQNVQLNDTWDKVSNMYMDIMDEATF